MASGANPLGSGGMNPMLQTILGALSKRTQEGAPSNDSAAAMAENQGADDGASVQQATQIRQAMGIMFVRSMQSRPNVANKISAAMKAWSAVEKEIQQAANVSEVVGKNEQARQPQPPISFSAATPGMGRPDATGVENG